jgi:hypothetical protein
MPGAPSGHASTPGQEPAPAGGPTPIRPTDKTSVKSWNKGPGGQALALVTTESGNVLMAHSAQQYPSMLHYCHALSGVVKQARAADPIPDARMEGLYQTSLAAFAAGSADCVAAITQHAAGAESTVTNVNHSLVDQAITELGAGVKSLYRATGSLRKQ